MTVSCKFPKDMFDAGLDSLRGVKGKSHPLGDHIGQFKSNPKDISCELIGIFLHLFDASVPIGFIDFLRVSRRHSMGAKKYHHLSNGPLLLPTLEQAVDPLFAKALDLCQTPWRLIDDLKGVGAKMIDNFFGVMLANPFD